MFYFAYGANMNLRDLSLRCDRKRKLRPRFKKATPATLPGYRLVFNVNSPLRKGGIANIVPEAQSTVEGVLYELFPGDTLSTFEFGEAEPHVYRKQCVTVDLPNGKQVAQVITLLADKKSMRSLKLSYLYKKTLLQGAKESKLSEATLKRLEKLPSTPPPKTA